MAEGKSKAEVSPELLRQVLNNFTLGADPEFVVLDDDGEQILNGDPHRVAWGGPSGAIGDDHNGRVWEIRPAPSPSSYGVLLNIWSLLKAAPLAIVEKFKWKSGALGGQDTLGGHVHYGLPNLSAVQLDSLSYVTEGLEALEILSSGESTQRRKRNAAYGNLKGVRDSQGHIEYRAPASWLGSPGQAFAALTSFKLAATRPDSCAWARSRLKMKANFTAWIDGFSSKDIDAHFLSALIERRGFEELQSDPESDFKPMWRKEELWQR